MRHTMENMLDQRGYVEHSYVWEPTEEQLKENRFQDPCEGELTPESVFKKGKYIGQIWICSECKQEYTDSELISQLINKFED